jgi:hypothetical protein
MDDSTCPSEDTAAINTRNIILSVVIIVISFIIVGTIGLMGFAYIFGLGWLDAFHNAAMYITGMGPIAEAQTPAQKVFASIYSLLGGFLFLGIAVYLIDEIVDIVFFSNRSQ